MFKDVIILSDGFHFAMDKSYVFNKDGPIVINKYIIDNYSNGKDVDPTSVVDTNINNGNLPKDNSIYAVITYKDVNVNGFCSNLCGYHTGRKIIFVGDPSRCGGGCGSDPGINNDFSADGVINVLSHEISETITDPYFDGWYDDNGAENGDKCAWQFGNVYTDHGRYNLVTSQGRYLIQMNWDPNSQSCKNGIANPNPSSSISSITSTTSTSTMTFISITSFSSSSIKYKYYFIYIYNFYSNYSSMTMTSMTSMTSTDTFSTSTKTPCK